jgi:hypothetical protein
MMCLAVTVPPVNEISGTSLCFTSADPAVGPAHHNTDVERNASEVERNVWNASASAKDHVDDALGEAGLVEQAAQHPGGEGGHLRGLGHDGVAHGDGRRHLPREEVQRQVPGRDGVRACRGIEKRKRGREEEEEPGRDETGDADGTADGVVDGALDGGGALLVVEDGGGEEAEVGDGAGDVHGAGQRHGLALVPRFGLSELFQILFD